jgi:hypothetical protein
MKRQAFVYALATLVSSMAFSLAPAGATPADMPARNAAPVVMLGAQLPSWSGPAADGVSNPYPYGANNQNPLPANMRGVRDAHAGTLIVPPAQAQTGVDPDKVAAYKWDGSKFVEIPVQVDERFPYFLSNPNSGFGFYSGVDKELTYEWDVESWKKTAGICVTAYPDGQGAMQDPVLTLDDDDEVAFMASDAGSQAPLGTGLPEGATGTRQEVRLADPRDPATQRFVYLFTKPGGSSFTTDTGYVNYDRDDNADEYIDRNTFADTDPEKVGTSNTGYGPNLSGTVCRPDLATEDPTDYTVDSSTDRFPRDGVTVTTAAYEWRATGRWMVRDMHVAKPGQPGVYGPDLVDRWKGRAFQQSPDSFVSLVGFEDEQVNWEGNSALLGELAGPVRAVRETWGADSGTNVTKTETFYRDAVTYRYRVRVHPIPPDGLYTSWDYNHDVASTYYNETRSDGVAIDGVNDEVAGNVDQAPTGQPAFFDAPDPTMTKPLANLNWEQVSGAGDSGSLVYIIEMKGPTTAGSPAVVPYYRDDACLDDGTGDDPSPRAYPGESYDWLDGRNDQTADDYLALPCKTNAPAGYTGPYRQGCFGCHGIHYFITGDTDNALTGTPLTEVDAQQWQFAAPTAAPTNVGDAYANNVKIPLIATATLQP